MFFDDLIYGFKNRILFKDSQYKNKFHELVDSFVPLTFADWMFLSQEKLTIRHVPSYSDASAEQLNGGIGDAYALAHLTFTNGKFDLSAFMRRIMADSVYVFRSFDRDHSQVTAIYDHSAILFFRALAKDPAICQAAPIWISQFLNQLLTLSIIQSLAFNQHSSDSHCDLSNSAYLIIKRKTPADYYDCNRYPLGKCGTAKFSAKEVIMNLQNNGAHMSLFNWVELITSTLKELRLGKYSQMKQPLIINYDDLSSDSSGDEDDFNISATSSRPSLSSLPHLFIDKNHTVRQKRDRYESTTILKRAASPPPRKSGSSAESLG